MSLQIFDPAALDRMLQLRRVGDVSSASPAYTRFYYNKMFLIVDKLFVLLDWLPKILLILLLTYLAIKIIKNIQYR